MKIRKMVKSDIDFIYDVGKEEVNFKISENLSGFWSKEQLEKWVDSKDDVLLVAEEGNEIVGFAIASLHKHAGKATFENLWITPELRGKRVAKKITLELLERLKEKGANYVCGMTKIDNEEMLGLFDKLGFDKGFKFYWMGKQI